ncbi:MarR family transcriptional regulator [Massilia sp. WF1]|uniref:MarR family winged helix-turn-helix transcriptional regulator n=1 Tax=unclassified Massilia TaxID=2609279 RepID=UPI00064B594B|nr:MULTISPECIES: MarR family transcriptional regulator [unclassified Massilia]ALK99970.1 MarR family transcriptional regulator [Massilia sp. WG5]KLU36787.1 MarR family transcriptional regulator [Massilia sp. WF1]
MTAKTKEHRVHEIAGAILKHWHEAVPNDRLAHLIKDATRAFLRSLQIRLAKAGVAIGHWTFLRILWEKDGLTQRELSIAAGVMEPTTLVALRSMEDLGYITREHAEGNKKNLHVFLTPEGKRLKRKLIPLAEEVNALAVEGLSDQEVVNMRRGLLLMIENLARAEAEENQQPAGRAASAKKPRGSRPA